MKKESEKSGESNKNEASEKEDILKKSAKEYFDSAEDELKKERYNSAVVLFFKSFVALIDLYILQKEGITPSSHSERFRLVQEKFPDIYDLLDKDFPFYQDSYVHILSKELAEVIKNDAEVMAGKTKINL
ncbi:MAG: hypothetical protein AABY22_00690 [Nanoarchaeota archaeon]